MGEGGGGGSKSEWGRGGSKSERGRGGGQKVKEGAASRYVALARTLNSTQSITTGDASA